MPVKSVDTINQDVAAAIAESVSGLEGALKRIADTVRPLDAELSAGFGASIDAALVDTRVRADRATRAMQLHTSLLEEAATFHKKNAPYMLANGEAKEPWIMTINRFDDLLEFYYNLDRVGATVPSFTGRKCDSMISFVRQFSAFANGYKTTEAPFYNRATTTAEQEYLYSRQTAEARSPGCTGTARSDLSCQPLTYDDGYVLLLVK